LRWFRWKIYPTAANAITTKTAAIAIPAFVAVVSPVLPDNGATLVEGGEDSVEELDGDAVWLSELTADDREVGVGVAVVPN
jgi:hypothetical protein